MIKVHVENVATGEPYVDQLIYIRENPQNVNQENSTVYEGYTNSEGKLFIDLKYRRNAKYFIFISLPESYCYLHSLSYPINKEKTNDIHFRLAPCAQLKLKIENVNCEGAGDEMRFRRLFIGQPAVNWSTKREGCYFFESPNYFDVPMGWVTYEWKGIQGGNEFYYIDSIYLDENQNGVMELNY